MGYYLASYLDFLGLQYISAGLERLVLYLYPTIVMLLSALFLKKPFTARGVFALALSYAGIALVFVHDVRLSDPAAVRLGATLVFCSALAYAIYLVGSSETIKRVGSVRFTALAMIVSCLLCVLQFIVLRPVVSLFSQPWQVYGYGAIVAVFCTVIPTFMISEALKHLGANAVSLAGASGPVATLVLGVLLLGEPMGWLQIVGGVLVVAGVLVITLKPMPKLAGPTILPKSALGNR